jgi:predicted Fe-S protein YdhL (DUF1289 family)
MLTDVSSECYWGDNGTFSASSNSDCNMPCSGDGTQVCSGGNRLTLYEDTTWTNPSRKELADALRSFYQLNAEIASDVEDWNNAITAYGSGPSSKKRDVTEVPSILRRRTTVLNNQLTFGEL